jgi:hypothetical protein
MSLFFFLPVPYRKRGRFERKTRFAAAWHLNNPVDSMTLRKSRPTRPQEPGRDEKGRKTPLLGGL